MDPLARMSNPTNRDSHLSPLDRSKCLFPSSSKDSNATGWRSIRTDSLRVGDSSLSTNITTGAVPAALKIAWVLTLQCFIVADVFSFGYNGPVNVNGASGERKPRIVAALYVTRTNPSESVRSLIARFERKERASIPPRDPEGYEINIVEGGLPRHQCNTAICYRAELEQHDGSTLEDPSHQEVSPDYISPYYQLTPS